MSGSAEGCVRVTTGRERETNFKQIRETISFSTLHCCDLGVASESQDILGLSEHLGPRPVLHIDKSQSESQSNPKGKRNLASRQSLKSHRGNELFSS